MEPFRLAVVRRIERRRETTTATKMSDVEHQEWLTQSSKGNRIILGVLKIGTHVPLSLGDDRHNLGLLWQIQLHVQYHVEGSIYIRGAVKPSRSNYLGASIQPRNNMHNKIC